MTNSQARSTVDPVSRTAPPTPGRSMLRVLTCNLRYDNPADGANAWPSRRDWLAEVVRGVAPDVVGFQEAQRLMVETDAIIAPRRNASRALVTKEQQAFDEALAAHKNHIGRAWEAVRSDPDVVRYFGGVVSKMITMNPTATLIVVEGIMVQDLSPTIIPDLKNNFMVWNLAPGVEEIQPELPDSANKPPKQVSQKLFASLRSQFLP